ncbi:galactinol--sucrose galactosyltransferase-like [Olea europaea subsp. europaea]|uniref:galactinol--sucrose galactosyltransferase n=1 Tax=Olea europaea subsp. europaea TaxID=158383 RepID=A0A8S0P7Q0_OLEEU|nr:galactinol--sucrose galactosyltransferase-like [Olea europaea subsp. europaea]
MAPSLSKISPDSLGPIGCVKPSSITHEGSQFLANGHPVLTHVPPNIISTPSPFISKDLTTNTVGCFVGFNSDESRSRHVLPIGKLKNTRFMKFGGQLIGPYVLLLPLIEGPYRASLQAGVYDDDVDICVESGSTKVCSCTYRSCVYMHVGFDPYNLIKDAMQVIRVHLGTFKLLEEKCPPTIVDKFGWCTWDAFYLKVHPQGVWGGVKALTEGGCPPGLVLIDDGWQSISHDDDDPNQEGMNRTSAGEQMPCRLIKFQENHKFRDYKSPKMPFNKGMGAFVRDLKEEFKTIESVYVWHALCGYWGGIRPNVPCMPESMVISPRLSEGLQMTMEDLAVDKIVKNGVGLVPPDKVYQMFEGLHSHLESVGIDGVKVHVIHLLEMLSEDFGGRVELSKDYYKALTASVRKHFNGNGVIASMEHCNDFMFLGTEAIALGRVGDDFWCTDPSGDPNGTFWLQGCHMVHCAYNSLWMGNFIQPDWDMFQSTHPCAEFHAASRAVSGGPIYVSDSVGKHNFQLLKSLVLPDGSILRCQHYALPTRDCLIEDPMHDGKTMLKIWNLNKFTGVLGAFNCQGGGWCPVSRRNKSTSEFSVNLTCLVSPKEIEWGHGRNPIPLKGIEIFAVYKYKEGKLRLLKTSEYLEIALDPFDYELFVVSPVKVLSRKLVQYAPIGLVNMLNSGGAIQSLGCDHVEGIVRVGVKGSGEMKIFASEEPRSCTINRLTVDFSYDDHVVVVQVPWPDSSDLSVIEYVF